MARDRDSTRSQGRVPRRASVLPLRAEEPAAASVTRNRKAR